MGNMPTVKNRLNVKNRFNVKNRHAIKYSFLCAFTVLIMLVLLSFPGSAKAVLDIQVTESINLTDEFDGTTLTQGAPTGEGEINITNMLTTELYDISLNFSEGGTSGWAVSTGNGVDLDTTGDGYVIVHINSLAEGGSAIITYSCTGSRPVIFSESYNTSKILVGGSVNVSLTLENNASSAITGIQLIKTAADVNDNSTFDFTFSNPDVEVGDVSAIDDTITWNGFSLDADSNATLNFTATESDPGAHQNAESLSAVEHYIGNTILQFTITDGSESGSGVGLNEEPTATTSNFEISLQKNQLDQSEGGNGGGDDWGFTPTIENTDTEEISFSISSVNLYVTTSTALQDTSAVNSTSYTSQTISNGETWNQDEWKIYDFPEPVPVGWIDVDLSVDFSGAQLSEAYSTTNGTYELIEKIYIINGYLVEAKKSIAKNATNADQYDIILWVHNKGNLVTPDNVYVYDIVPNNFSMVYNDTVPEGTTQVSSPITGMAYWWNVGPLQPDTQEGDEVTIHYTVEGTGLYSLTDLFILGIDPSYTLNMQSTPVIRNGVLVTSRAGVKPVLGMLMMAFLLLGMVGLKKKKQNK